MPTQGPWYITAAAVKELMAIKGLPAADDGTDFDACEEELIAQARAIVDAGKAGRALDSGAVQYRGGRPLRLRLTVSPAPRREGGKPQLVRVQPDHEGRGAGPYAVANRVNPPKRVRDATSVEVVRNASGPAYDTFPIRVPNAERVAWQRAADAAGVPLSEWIRDVLRRASGR